MMAILYDVEPNTINYHLKKAYSDKELDEQATIRNFRVVRTEGTRDVEREICHAKSETTKKFFANVQNKMHFAVTGHTAAEIVYNRADSEKPNMGLTSWEGSPYSKVHKYDVSVAKNYLSEKELRNLALLVSGYLNFAENRAERHIPMTMKDWAERLNSKRQ